MTTYLEPILEPCSQKLRIGLLVLIVLTALMFFLLAENEAAERKPEPTTNKSLLQERNCLRVRVENPNQRLSSEDLARIAVKYYWTGSINSPGERSEAISPLLNLNTKLRCGTSNTVEAESLCLKNSEMHICIPLTM